MSAIAGFLHFNARPAAGEDLVAMLDRMAAYRHADARSGWHGDVAALGLLLEHHTPEDLLERQPLPDPSGRFLLVGDLRLDNRDELAHVFRLSHKELAEIPDSGLVMRAWLRWRERAPEHLLGDFAFVVLDREARSLYCARDHVGVRPFYYIQTAHRFAFASAIKGLLALSDVPRVIDEQGFADFLVLLADDLQRTCWSGIKRLPAGHWLTLSGEGRVHLERYWRPENVREQRLGSDDAYTDALQEAMTRAVVPRMRSIHPHGVLLSGGLDSSTVACYAADEALKRGERLTAASSVLPDGWTGPERDEWEWIKLVADSRTNIDVVRVSAPGLGILDGLDEMLAINDQPFRDGFHYLTRALFESARQNGARNILGGYGGDHVVSSHGAGFLAELARTGKVLTLIRELKARKRPGRSMVRHMVAQVLLPNLPASIQRGLDHVRNRRRTVWDDFPLLDQDYLGRCGLEERLERRMRAARPNSVRAQEIESLELRTRSDALEYFAQLGAFLRIRHQCPLLDKDLIELSLSMPATIKVRSGLARCLIRRAGTGRVPDATVARIDKQAFDPIHGARVKDQIGQMRSVLEAAHRSAPWLEQSRLAKYFAERASGGAPGADVWMISGALAGCRFFQTPEL